MNLNDLKYFEKLSELKSFSKTASFFNISQPTVTYSVKRLEEEFNTNLLNRNNKSHTVSLSDTGEQLLVHIKKILFEMDVAHQDIKEMNFSKLKVGFPPIITNYFSYLFSVLEKKNIFNNIEAITGESQSLMNQLMTGKIDITLIGSLTPLDNPELNTFLLATHKFKIISAKNNKLSNKKTVSLANIKHNKLIMLDEKSIHNTALSRLSSPLNIRLSPSFKTTDYKLALNLIENNQGVGFFTETAISNPDVFNIYDIKEADNMRFYIYLAYRKSKFVTNNMNQFIDLFKIN